MCIYYYIKIIMYGIDIKVKIVFDTYRLRIYLFNTNCFV